MVASEIHILLYAPGDKLARLLPPLFTRLGAADVRVATSVAQVQALLADAARPVAACVLEFPSGQRDPALAYQAIRRHSRTMEVLLLGKDTNRFIQLITAKDSYARGCAQPINTANLTRCFAAMLERLLASEATPEMPDEQTASGAAGATDPDGGEAAFDKYLATATTLLARKNATKALAILKRLESRHPGDARLHGPLAEAYAMLDRPDKAAHHRALETAKPAPAAAKGAERPKSGWEKTLAAAGTHTAAKAPGAPEESPDQNADNEPRAWAHMSDEQRRKHACTFYNPDHVKRSVFRLCVPDHRIRIHGQDVELQAIDLSASGVGFEAPRPLLQVGQTFEVDIMRDGEAVLQGLPCQAMNTDAQTVGCRFVDLPDKVEAELDRLLLEEQKRAAKKAPHVATGAGGAGGKKKVYKLSF